MVKVCQCFRKTLSVETFVIQPENSGKSEFLETASTDLEEKNACQAPSDCQRPQILDDPSWNPLIETGLN